MVQEYLVVLKQGFAEVDGSGVYDEIYDGKARTRGKHMGYCHMRGSIRRIWITSLIF